MPEDNSGHNSDTYKATASELRSYVERIEKFEEERKDLGLLIREVKAEAKGRGYDPKALTEILRRRKRAREEVTELDAIIALYEDTLGIFD